MRHSLTQDYNNNTNSTKNTNDTNEVIITTENTEVVLADDSNEAIETNEATKTAKTISPITTYSTRNDYNNFPQLKTEANNEASPDSTLIRPKQHASSACNEFDFSSQAKTISTDQQQDIQALNHDIHCFKRAKGRTLVEKIPPRRLFLTAVRKAWSLKARGMNHVPRQQLDFSSCPLYTDDLLYTSEDTSSKPVDVPPITAKTLNELSVLHLFSCLQVRHDLLVDSSLSFRPTSTPEKRRHSEKFWGEMERLIKKRDNIPRLIKLTSTIIKDLADILSSLVSPFPDLPSATIVWHWPTHITETEIRAVLDPDLVDQQITNNCFDIDLKFDFLLSILSPLCPNQAESIETLVQCQEYAASLEEIFLTLEMIKLDVANKSLRYYRPYLIDSATPMEWNFFLGQVKKQEIDTRSVSTWLFTTWTRMGMDTKFDDVFCTAVMNLVTDDENTINALGLPSTPFPISFRYDEKQLGTLMRQDFQNIIVISLLLIPYRLMAGKKSKEEHIKQLKVSFARLLREASLTDGRVSCFLLALQAVNFAKEVQPITQDSNELATYWSMWMHKNLRNASPVYRIMYDRVRSLLFNGMKKGTMKNMRKTHATVGLESEITRLGKTLIVLVDYNKRTYGQLYQAVVTHIRKHSQPL